MEEPRPVQEEEEADREEQKTWPSFPSQLATWCKSSPWALAGLVVQVAPQAGCRTTVVRAETARLARRPSSLSAEPCSEAPTSRALGVLGHSVHLEAIKVLPAVREVSATNLALQT